MKDALNINKAYGISEQVVAREVQGELIIIPIASGIGDTEDEMFTLNENGRYIWGKLDGKKTLSGIIAELSEEFSGPKEEIKEDVLGFTRELLARKIVVEA